ncbi:MAG: hypothetical protein WDN31_02940 [Hyphomicrobium sp.]
MRDDPKKWTKDGLLHGNTLRRKPELVRFGSSLSHDHMARLKQMAGTTGMPLNQLLMLGIDKLWDEFDKPDNVTEAA